MSVTDVRDSRLGYVCDGCFFFAFVCAVSPASPLVFNDQLKNSAQEEKAKVRGRCTPYSARRTEAISANLACHPA